MARGKFDKQWFVTRLREREWSQREFAKKVGIDAGRISVLFKGSKAMLLHEAQSIGDKLHVAASEVLKHAGIPVETPRTVKVVGHVNGEDGVVHYVATGTEDDVEAPSGLPDTAFALQLRAHSTRLAAFDRWLVFVSGQKLHPQKLLRQLVLLGLKDQSVLLAHIRGGYQGNTITMTHGMHEVPNVQAVWAMRVLWARQVEEWTHDGDQ